MSLLVYGTGGVLGGGGGGDGKFFHFFLPYPLVQGSGISLHGITPFSPFSYETMNISNSVYFVFHFDKLRSFFTLSPLSCLSPAWMGSWNSMTLLT